MKEFKIEIGNSFPGPLGAVVYLYARSKEHAIERFKAMLAPDGSFKKKISGHDRSDLADASVIIYVNLSLLTVKEVEECE